MKRLHSTPSQFETSLVLARKTGLFLLVCTLLAVIATQEPLYSDNQNTKFLHGMAWAGVGHLQSDWLAQTADGLPVFSALIYVVYAFLPPLVIYALFALLLGVYFFGITGILSKAFEFPPGSLKHLALCGTVFFIHSDLFHFKSIYDGVAEQYLLGRYFQPCVFGVFIFLSVNLFLKRREFLASAALALAYLMHPAYFFIAAVLIWAYGLEVIREKRGAKALLATTLPFVVCAAAYLLYLKIEFRPTSSQTFAQAMHILAFERIPHHSLVQNWIGSEVYIKLGLVALALVALRKTRLFPLLSWAVAATMLFTLVQVATKSDSLALLAPWRASVVIMPLALFSVIAWAISSVPEKWEQTLLARKNIAAALCLLILLALTVGGVKSQMDRLRKYTSRPEMPLLQYVAANKQPSDIYLIPNRDSIFVKFRLETGAPAFVNWKSHPYKDTEVLEWYRRNQLADRIYEADKQILPLALDEILTKDQVSHIIAPTGGRFSTCSMLKPEYSNTSWSLYRIEPRPDK